MTCCRRRYRGTNMSKLWNCHQLRHLSEMYNSQCL